VEQFGRGFGAQAAGDPAGEALVDPEVLDQARGSISRAAGFGRDPQEAGPEALGQTTGSQHDLSCGKPKSCGSIHHEVLRAMDV
jgi:hypothetical protein